MSLQFDTSELTVTSETALPTIWVASLPAGSGKTRSIINNTILSGKPTIITTPTDTLSFQYEGYFLSQDIVPVVIEPVVISRKRNPDRNSHDHFRDAVKCRSRVILVSRDVFHETDISTEGFDVYEDEYPDILDIITFENAELARDLLVKLLECKTLTKSARYYELELTTFAKDIAKDGWKAAIIRDSEDLLKLCKRLESKHFRVYILADTYKKYREGKIAKLQFWTIMLPTILRGASPTIVGANGEDTFMMKLWAGLAVFRAAEAIDGDYTTLAHLNGRARIIYLSKRKVTGTVLSKVKHQRAYDAAADVVEGAFPGQGHIIGFNNNPVPHGKPFTWKLKHAKQMQLVPHGQNDAKHLHLAVCLGTQFYDPATYKFLKSVFDLDGDEVDRAFGLERLYQLAMRISAREFESDQPFTIVVWDEDSALFLQEKMGGTIEYMDTGIAALQEEEGFKPKAKSKEQRTAEAVAAIYEKREKEKMDLLNPDNTKQYDGYKVFVQKNIGVKEFAGVTMSWFDLSEYLEIGHNTYQPKSKKQSQLFREGELLDFKTNKLVNNIVSTKLVFLDMDHIKGDPRLLSDFLYENGWSHFIYNTHSSTPLDQCIRVVIGLSEAVNAPNYLHVINLLVADIYAHFDDADCEDEDRLFPVDDSKMTINNRFFNPAVSEYKAPLFIKRHVMKAGTFEPKFVDVRFFLSRNPVSVSKPKSGDAPNKSAARQPKNKATIEAILDRWSVPAHRPGTKGLGSWNYHQAAVDLKKAGFSKEDSIQILAENRHRFGDGNDRDAVYTVNRVWDEHLGGRLNGRLYRSAFRHPAARACHLAGKPPSPQIVC